ncbi:ATP-binding protein [uncultured Legionella sp.]|uniref:ATP-binding protein n=1 Tax=uncultured Legionella sp. TaxID=210934 RepID=UPI002630C24A|nr:ATP-binding protein [uncultured Legionella sp.]
MSDLQKIIDEKNEEIEQLKLRLEEEQSIFQSELDFVRDYYESMLALMPGHVYWLDRNNVFLGCNDSQAKDACLSSRKEIVGKTNFDMPWKDQAEELNKLNNLVMDTGVPHTAEEYAVMAHGMAIYISHKVPLRNKLNDVIGILGISMEITEHKKMEVALRRAKENAEVANQAKTEFIANMSHDIYTPLSGIVGMSKLMEEKAHNPEQKQYARWINESGEQLLELLKGVMEVAAADNVRESDVQTELFDLYKNIQDIAHLVRPTVQMKRIQLHIELDKNFPRKFITDGTKLYKALLNLVGNAIKFTDEGSVTIKVMVLAQENDYVQLKFSVSDTGIGVPCDLQVKIFDRFFRAHPGNKGKQGGYGVGLHIAQKYVNLLGGEINLDSEVGKGSTFYFTLTLKIDSSEREKKAHLVDINSPLILLVENNIRALRLIESVVEQAGYQYYSAVDSEHAMELIETNDFDLIMINVELSDGADKNITQRIRDWELQLNKKPVPIIGLTRDELTDMQQDSLQPGMNKLLTKPIHLKGLQLVVSELVELNDGHLIEDKQQVKS